jgi:protein-S-isoprenylcysteine O-methyltransferase Ste14
MQVVNRQADTSVVNDADRQPDHTMNDTETAGVVARPPLLFLGALVVAAVLEYVWTLPFPIPGTQSAHRSIGGGLFFTGLAVAVSGVRDFTRAGTPVPTNQPTRALVTQGAHRWSRNPIYLGMFGMYGGIGVAAQSVWTLLLALPVAIVIRYGVVDREEAYLERRFGEAYRDYKGRVRRWL